ncbi:hypothetical protein SCALM49S_04936 [Streptomyces californicus]
MSVTLPVPIAFRLPEGSVNPLSRRGRHGAPGRGVSASWRPVLPYGQGLMVLSATSLSDGAHLPETGTSPCQDAADASRGGEASRK